MVYRACHVGIGVLSLSLLSLILMFLFFDGQHQPLNREWDFADKNLPKLALNIVSFRENRSADKHVLSLPLRHGPRLLHKSHEENRFGPQPTCEK
jgi:hypothetical protein